jgi:CBS domain-containing protein
LDIRMERLQDLMSTELLTVDPSTTVAEAAHLMSIRRVGCALVVERDDLRGILTERDIVRALAAEHDAATHAVAEWMTATPVTQSPGATPTEALRLMLEAGFRHLPVVEDGRLVGIVSIRDLSGRLL